MRRAVLAAVAAVGLCASAAVQEPAGAYAEGKPNVVVVMTDDQRFDELPYMPKTQALLVKQGTSFDGYYNSYPLCCPARTAFLTGQYAHNHGVRSNAPATGGYSHLRKRHTIGAWMQRAGYRTAWIGKYLNGYGNKNRREVPPGWKEWYGAPGVDAYRVYNFTLNENRRLVTYRKRPKNYQTRVYGRLASSFIDRARRPFFLVISPTAPHSEHGAEIAEGTIAPRSEKKYAGAMQDASLPENPAFGEPDVSDKPAVVRGQTPLSAQQKAFFQSSFRRRLRSLRSVDDMVGRLVNELRAEGKLDNTYFILMSDNGYLLGEHNLSGKIFPYQESIHVPLVIRGPGVPADVRLQGRAIDVDLAPTIADIGDAVPTTTFDGMSLLPAAQGEDFTSRPSLLEVYDYFPYIGVRAGRWKYVHWWTGEQELYDLIEDPNELDNVAPGHPVTAARLDQLSQQLSTCTGMSCQDPEPLITPEPGPDPGPPVEPAPPPGTDPDLEAP